MGVPLWGGVAPAAHAARLLANMQAADMRSRWGLRSTSSNDTRYSNANIIKPCA
jgi:glycogen debranching enzyme